MNVDYTGEELTLLIVLICAAIICVFLGIPIADVIAKMIAGKQDEQKDAIEQSAGKGEAYGKEVCY